jgi:hypothetical protein
MKQAEERRRCHGMAAGVIRDRPIDWDVLCQGSLVGVRDHSTFVPLFDADNQPTWGRPERDYAVGAVLVDSMSKFVTTVRLTG